jgi:hypothetical protein
VLRLAVFGLAAAILSGCLEPAGGPASEVALTTTLPVASTPPPEREAEWRPSLCGGGAHGSAQPRCVVLRLVQVPAGLQWEDLRARTGAGEAVGYDRGQEASGPVQPSPPSRPGATPISWCKADAFEDSAWCAYGPDPAGAVSGGESVLVWWTDDAAVEGKTVQLVDASGEPFAQTGALA